MAIDLKNRHWCSAIETKETKTELVLQVEVLEIQTVAKLKVYVEPRHISITAVYFRDQQERKKKKLKSNFTLYVLQKITPKVTKRTKQDVK